MKRLYKAGTKTCFGNVNTLVQRFNTIWLTLRFTDRSTPELLIAKNGISKIELASNIVTICISKQGLEVRLASFLRTVVIQAAWPV